MECAFDVKVRPFERQVKGERAEPVAFDRFVVGVVDAEDLPVDGAGERFKMSRVQ